MLMRLAAPDITVRDVVFVTRASACVCMLLMLRMINCYVEQQINVLSDLLPHSPQERLMSKAYSEAVRDQPPGHFLVTCSTFVTVARNFGFDRWKVGV